KSSGISWRWRLWQQHQDDGDQHAGDGPKLLHTIWLISMMEAPTLHPLGRRRDGRLRRPPGIGPLLDWNGSGAVCVEGGGEGGGDLLGGLVLDVAPLEHEEQLAVAEDADRGRRRRVRG